MSVEEAVLKLPMLPSEKQQEVVSLIEKTSGARPPLRSVEGLWADLGLDITEEDIRGVRREMWIGFPRDFTKGPSG